MVRDQRLKETNPCRRILDYFIFDVTLCPPLTDRPAPGELAPLVNTNPLRMNMADSQDTQRHHVPADHAEAVQEPSVMEPE